MMNFALFCAILFSSFSSCALPREAGVREAVAICSEEGMLVAVIPEATSSYEEKKRRLQSYVERLSSRYGVPVQLTEDLRAYMSLERIARRGASSFERAKLEARGEVIAKYGITA